MAIKKLTEEMKEKIRKNLKKGVYSEELKKHWKKSLENGFIEYTPLKLPF